MKVIKKAAKTPKPDVTEKNNSVTELNKTKTSLSDSILWHEMRQYYQNLGPEAWQQDIVPYQITSNKLLAQVYANVISAAIHQDVVKLNIDNNKTRDLKTYHIIELGAGHGKFSFYVCKYLDNYLQRYDLYNKVKILYIASDICDKNIQSWQTHPMLKKYIDSGQLDFAKFNAETDDAIYLINSKQTINKRSIKNNLFVIANYVFDSLSHDAFKCQDKKLFATYINIITDQKNQKNKKMPKEFSFNNIDYKYSHEPIKSNYYDKYLFNQMLSDYQLQLDDGSFLLPVGAFKAIENIKEFSTDNTVFLVADKGNKEIADFEDLEEPNIALHGSISFMVNFHAIKQFVDLLGGAGFIGSNSYTDLQIGCFIVANNRLQDIDFLDFVVKEILYDANPQNLISLCYIDDQINTWSNLDQILSILSISKWDPDLFYDCSEQLLHFIEKSIKNKQFNIDQERAIVNGLNLVWEYFFKLEINQDIPFVLANIYYVLEEFEIALSFFKISIKDFGETAESLYNVALCYYALGNKALAIKYTKKSLHNNNKYLAACRLLTELIG